MKLLERIDELFHAYCGPNGTLDLRSTMKLFWPTLQNSCSIVDLAGLFSVTIPSTNVSETLTVELFQNFFRAFARLKFPTGADFCERLIEELKSVQSNRKQYENGILNQLAEKNVIRIILKYDLQLRRAFSMFSGQAVRIGGVVSWDEVKNLGLGMEFDGFLSFGGAYSMVPQHVSTQQCDKIFKEVITKYSLVANNSTLKSNLLYPQFQLILALIAVEVFDTGGNSTVNNVNTKVFAKKTIDTKGKALWESMQDLFTSIGISKFDAKNLSYSIQSMDGHHGMHDGASTGNNNDDHSYTGSGSASGHHNNLFVGSITNPASSQPQDLYTSSLSHTRQSMLLRLENLFDETFTNVSVTYMNPNDPLLTMLTTSSAALLDESNLVDMNTRLPTKPVVIGDALPIPTDCPETVQQLLEASLAHHNSSAFDESLKFLEAAKIQLQEIIKSLPKTITGNGSGNGTGAIPTMSFTASLRPTSPAIPDTTTIPPGNTGTGNTGNVTGTTGMDTTTTDPHTGNNNSSILPRTTTQLISTLNNPNRPPYFDILMYINLCKGNVYQSCGDDEQSLIQYVAAWQLAKKYKEMDWEMICINSAGMLAFFNLRYDVSLVCFSVTLDFRERTYGAENPDSATALNNVACSLYCVKKRGEARLRFEKAWHLLSKSIGHRALRTLTVWKNLEKARRSHAPLQSTADKLESIGMRPDADRLIVGGTFTIQALPPIEAGKKKKKGGGGKKKKGK